MSDGTAPSCAQPETSSTGSSVAAERGYLREAGNLVFHVSLLFLLLGVAIGALWGYRGSSVVIVTHSERVAETADRVIEMRDGTVIG